MEGTTWENGSIWWNPMAVFWMTCPSNWLQKLVKLGFATTSVKNCDQKMVLSIWVTLIKKNLGPNIEFLLPAGWACQRLGSSTVPNQTEVPRALFNRSCVAMSRACAKLTGCDVVDLVLWYLGVSRAAICTLQIRHLVLRCLTRCRPGWLWNIAFCCDAGFGFESSQDSIAASSIVLPKRISTVLLFA